MENEAKFGWPVIHRLIDWNYIPLLVIPFGSDTVYFRTSTPCRWYAISGSIDFQ